MSERVAALLIVLVALTTCNQILLVIRHQLEHALETCKVIWGAALQIDKRMMMGQGAIAIIC